MMMWWWILIPVVFVLIIFPFNRRNKENKGKKENPMDMLDKRFVKDEITKEEYEGQKRTLNTKN